MKKVIAAFLLGIFFVGFFIAAYQLFKVDAANITITSPTSSSRYSSIPINLNQTAAILPNSLVFTFTPVPVGTPITVTIDPVSNPLVTNISPTAVFNNVNVTNASSSTIPDNFYNVSIQWQRASDGVTESVALTSVIVDTTTLPIIYNEPNNGVYGTSLPMYFSVPENVLPNTLRATLTGSSVVTITFINSSLYLPFTINPRNVTSSSNVQSSSSGAAIPPGTYSIQLSYQDDLGNPVGVTPGASTIIILPDPSISINAPTKSGVNEITNTTIKVTAQEPIPAANVVIGAGTTVNYSNFNCDQTSISEVNCTIKIKSSGNLVIAATASSTLSASRAENDYVVTTSSGTPVPQQQPSSEPSATDPDNNTETNVDIKEQEKDLEYGDIYENVVSGTKELSESRTLDSEEELDTLRTVLIIGGVLAVLLILLAAIGAYLGLKNPKVKVWVSKFLQRK